MTYKKRAKLCTKHQEGKAIVWLTTESKAESTDKCKGPPLDLITHLVQSSNAKCEVPCNVLPGRILLELIISCKTPSLLFHLAFPAGFRNLREAPRN